MCRKDIYGGGGGQSLSRGELKKVLGSENGGVRSLVSLRAVQMNCPPRPTHKVLESTPDIKIQQICNTFEGYKLEILGEHRRKKPSELRKGKTGGPERGHF